jgi:hypothetical protein
MLIDKIDDPTRMFEEYICGIAIMIYTIRYRVDYLL